MTSNLQRWTVIGVSLAAGGGDLFTGLLLVFAPEWTLAQMVVPPAADAVFLRFVGVFVACVGAGYVLGLLAWWLGGRSGRLRFVWEWTILFRLAAGAFVALQIVVGHLAWRWCSVPAVDWTWAVVQVISLRADIFCEEYA